MTTCDLYLRLSDGRTENGSFVEREKALRDKASMLGWTVRKVVIENDLMAGSRNASAFKRRRITLPDGSTAMRVVRPGFRSILDDLAAGRIDAILAEDLDRTMRDPRDAEDLIDVLRDRGAWADSLSGSLKFTAGGTDAERMMARIAVTVANKSSADTARRVAGGRARKAAAGQWGGGRRPYGFTPQRQPSGNHANTVLVVCEPEAAVIRACADQILAGISMRQVAKGLRDKGVPTVTGTQWTAQTLRDVMLRELNAGIIVLRGKETDVRLPGEPILTEDVWRAVVAKLTDPERATPGRAPCWLGTGIYRCVCGSPMAIQGGATRATTYKCAREGGTGDVHVRRNAEHVDAYVTAVLVARMSMPDAADLMPAPTGGPDVKALRREATALRERKAQLAAAYGAGDLDDVEYGAARKANAAKLTAIEAQLSTVADRSPLAPLIGAADVRAAWKRLTLGQQRAILADVAVVTVLPSTRKGRGFDESTVDIRPKA